MSEVSFDRNPNAPAQEQPVPAQEIAQQQNAVVVHQPQAVLAPEPFVLGDFLPSFKDVILPRVNIVQNIGELKDMFSPGELVYGKSTVLFTPPRINPRTGNQEDPGTGPVIVTFLGRVSERFSEKTVGGARGLIVADEASVRNCGGTLDYEEWKLKKDSGMKRFEPLDDLLVAIERPNCCKDDDTVFVFAANGKKYTFGFWAMKGTAYTEALKRVVYKDRAIGCLRGQFPDGGFPNYSYAISTREKGWEGTTNTAHIPILIPHEKNSPEFKELISGFISRQK